MSEYFDDELLQKFMHNFYGYGNYQGDYWFIGMEEGGGNSFAEINRRLAIWKEGGYSEIEDVVEYHLKLGTETAPWFSETPKLQATWSKLIRVLLSSERRSPTTDEVREYQQRLWARRTGSACLLELLPLPSPSTSQWLYGKHSQLPDLANRERYRATWSQYRINALRQRILQYQPKVVVFYSFNYLPYWQEIVSADLKSALSNNIYVCQTASQLNLVIKHPVAQGITNEYFHEVGQYIRLVLAGKLKP